MKKLKSKWITKQPDTRLYQIPVPIVALTGGIATGKSTVAQFFRDENIPVIDADQLVKSIYQKKESIDFISKQFPEAIIADNIDFKILRKLAFSNPKNQQLLENFIYAQMPQAFKEAYVRFGPHEYIVYDVPLLFEKKLDTQIDVSVCTYAPRQLQIERLVKRDHIQNELAETILSRQMDIEEKKKLSDLVIDNLTDVKELKNNFDKLLKNLSE